MSNFWNAEGHRGWFMVFALGGMVTGSLLIIWYGWLGFVEVRGCGWYVLGGCMDGVYGFCVWLLFKGDSVGLGDGLVRYSCLVGKLITPPCVCRKSLPNTTGKRISLVTASCIGNVSLSMAMGIKILPRTIRGLSSGPGTKNGACGGACIYQNRDGFLI